MKTLRGYAPPPPRPSFSSVLKELITTQLVLKKSVCVEGGGGESDVHFVIGIQLLMKFTMCTTLDSDEGDVDGKLENSTSEYAKRENKIW